MLSAIPRVAHLYLGGKMPFLRYATIASFQKHNPDWSVVLHEPCTPSASPQWTTWEQKGPPPKEDCRDMLRNVRRKTFRPSEHGFPDDLPEVHRADVCRFAVLATEGGLWLDTDILFFRPLEAHFADVESPAVFCHAGFHSAGFLATAPDNPEFKALLQEARKGGTGYQAYGPDILNRLYPNGLMGYNMPLPVLYPIYWRNMGILFCEAGPAPEFHDSIGVHWYGGCPIAGEYAPKITRGNWRTLDTRMGSLLRGAL